MSLLSKLKLYKIYLLTFLFGVLFFFIANYGWNATSTNEYCQSCHIHPQAISSWKLGPHVYNNSGVTVNCVDCHLPPSGFERVTAKAYAGLKDVYGYIMKDSADLDWQQMSQRESAIHHVYQSGCLKCHQNLFPPNLSRKGEDAHLYYDQNQDQIRCINCHLETGHYHEKKLDDNLIVTENLEIYESPAELTTFESYNERIVGTTIDFEMIAIPKGKFIQGSPDEEELRNENEGPQVNVNLDQFWIGKAEVSWDEYSAFIRETGKEGRTEDQVKSIKVANNVDAITGPTPAYGNPGQGWGRGKKPAITMTYYAAEKYCEWLSIKTGKKYRLSTESEWEYACRGNSDGAYYFEGSATDYTSNGFLKSIFGVDTTLISSFVIYKENSGNKTASPHDVKENPFGLVNMLGNVKEFCSDFYDSKIYTKYKKEGALSNPTGPVEGKEHVVKGGSYKSDASEVRIASRETTKHKAWMVTDPQIPKSLWWYSDCKDVGFRVVCEYDSNILVNK